LLPQTIHPIPSAKGGALEQLWYFSNQRLFFIALPMKRYLAVIVVACLYLLVGIAVGIEQFPRLVTGQREAIGMEIAEAVAIVTGVCLLLRQGWARWLAVAWMAFHVAIMFSDPGKMIVHIVLCGLIAWALFRPESRGWFRKETVT
jgi:hypothetical protein